MPSGARPHPPGDSLYRRGQQAARRRREEVLTQTFERRLQWSEQVGVPQQLQGVFGEVHVNSMAQQAGMQPTDFLSQLSQYLPKAVDGATPNGQVPNEGSVSV